jgi:hypothetical protein
LQTDGSRQHAPDDWLRETIQGLRKQKLDGITASAQRNDRVLGAQAELPTAEDSCQAGAMALHPRSIFPPPLSAKLSALGTRIGKSDDELDEVLSGLSALPASLIVRASREIAMTAQLWWQPRQFISLELLLAKSELQLMRKNPDYAWLFLFHYSGYVREAALDAINTPPTSPFFFAALAWRLNDWVGPVRQAATRCAERVLHRIRADVAASAAQYLLDRRVTWGRWSDEPKVLDAVFGSKDVMAALAALLQEQTTGPLAACLRNALRYPNIDEHLPYLAANAIQPSVRAVACQCLVAGKASWPVGFGWLWIDKVYGLRRRVPKLETREIQGNSSAAEWIRKGVRDKSAFVRRVAADALIAARAQLPDENSLIARLANDRSPAVRSRADFMLRHPPSVPS